MAVFLTNCWVTGDNSTDILDAAPRETSQGAFFFYSRASQLESNLTC